MTNPDNDTAHKVLVEIERVVRNAGWTLDEVKLFRAVVSGEQRLEYTRSGADSDWDKSDDAG